MVKLYEPAGYKALSASEKEACCNGCGSKGLGGWLVPDSIWGLNITDVYNKWFRFLRRRRALKMYWVVKTFGEAAFWDNKV